jgi:hypothetical protein
MNSLAEGSLLLLRLARTRRATGRKRRPAGEGHARVSSIQSVQPVAGRVRKSAVAAARGRMASVSPNLED